MRHPLVAAIFMAFLLLACEDPGVPITGMGSENTLIETAEYTGVVFSKAGASEFLPILGRAPTSFWEPSVKDISRAEACIQGFLMSEQDDPALNDYQKEDAAYIRKNLENYRRQYVGLVIDGEKRIWVNSFFFDGSYPDWQRRPVYVLDGGNHFWQIEYVVDRDECIDFYVHGEA